VTETTGAAIILAGIAFAVGFRWGMGRLAEAIDAWRESWEELNGLRDKEEGPENAE
jgi:hypothetical protein